MPFRDRPSLAAAALDASPEGILVLDGHGVVVSANAAARALLGEDVEGSRLELPSDGILETGSPTAPTPPLTVRSTTVSDDGRSLTVATLRPLEEANQVPHAPAVRERLEDFVDQARGVFFLSSLDARVRYMSPGAEEFLGRSRREILEAEDPLSIVHPDDREEVAAVLADPDRAPYSLQYRVVRPDGVVRRIRQRGFPVTDAEGHTRRIVGTLEDVTDQWEERELLTHTLRLLQRTVSSLQEAVLVVDTGDPDVTVLSANPAAARIFGHDREALVGSSARALFPDAPAFDAFLAEARRTLLARGVFQTTGPLRRADGTEFPAEQTVAWLDPEQGLAGGVVSVVRDLSEQRRAETELRRSEERFRLIAERIDDVFWISSVDKSRMEYVSPAYESVWGRPVEDLYRDPTAWAEFLVEEDRERVLASLDRQRDGSYEEEYRIRRPDGEVRWVWDRAFPVEDETGRVTRIIGVAEDITERKRAEERFGVLSAEITDMLYVLDPEGRVRYTTPSVRHTLGYDPEEFLGSDVYELVHPDDRDRLRGQLRVVEDAPGEAGRAQYRMRAKNGEVLHVESIARNLIDNPAVEGIVVTTRDVTERLDLEEQLLQSQKMEAVGRLAGGIAHDFNNLLTVIRSQTDLLLLDLDDDSPLRADVATIQETGDRAAELTSQLLAFSRDQVLRPRLVDLSQVVRGLGNLLERIIGEDVEVRMDLADDLPAARVDPGQLEHVLMNLAVNARDAMPDGGELVLRTSRTRVAPDSGGTLPPGDYVSVDVRDTGVGMSDATRRRIFEPFFTTKPVGEGTGLGLAMAHGVVLQSGGDIQVQSEPGEGSTFTLCFPAVDGAPAEPLRRRGASRSPEGRVLEARVLVVEDDASVRRAVTRILERSGLAVEAVGRAEEALEALGAGTPVDLVLTDLVLPGMGGRTLVDHLRDVRPELPLVVMSGYAEGSPGQRGDLPPDIAFIQKPFDPVELVDTLRRALDGAGARD